MNDFVPIAVETTGKADFSKLRKYQGLQEKAKVELNFKTPKILRKNSRSGNTVSFNVYSTLLRSLRAEYKSMLVPNPSYTSCAHTWPIGAVGRNSRVCTW